MEKFSLHLRHPPQRSCSISIVYTYPVGDLGDYALSAAMSEVYACSIYYSSLLGVQKPQTWVNSTNSFPVKTFSFAAVENHMGELTK